MLKNYFLITLRNIFKQKSYSFINIAGLAVGLASFILIVLWVQDEFSFDGFHQNFDNIFRIQDRNAYVVLFLQKQRLHISVELGRR